MNYQLLCENAVDLIKETGEYVRQQREILNDDGVETKGKNDFVTVVDKASEELLVAGLAKLLPESGFIAEEGTNDKVGEVYNWIIDPIDGTTNFIHNAPPFCISVALQENGVTIMGIVYEIHYDECFYSYKGGKVYLNGKEVTVSKKAKLADSMLATGFPYSVFERIDDFLQTLVYFFKNSHGVRRLGSAAADLAYVACGRYEGFYEYNLKPWDVAAGTFLVEQAGGKVADFKGGDDYLYGKEIVAANGLMFDEFWQAVNKLMVKN